MSDPATRTGVSGETPACHARDEGGDAIVPLARGLYHIAPGTGMAPSRREGGLLPVEGSTAGVPPHPVPAEDR